MVGVHVAVGVGRAHPVGVTAPDGTEWVSVSEAARRFRLTPTVIYQWRQRGRVRSHNIGGQVFVCAPDAARMEAAWRARKRLQ